MGLIPSRACDKIPDLPTRFAELRRFHFLYDVEDAPAAARLRAELIRTGTVEASTDATSVVLLTNCTTTAWLSQHAELLQKGVVTVIGSAIGLPPSLHWLWRRQWIDLRRWDATRRRKNPVPAVPEGMTRLRIPAIVRLNEHLFCAMAGLLGVLANVVFPPDSSKSDTLRSRDWVRRSDRRRLHILDRCRVAADSSPDHSTALRRKNQDFVRADTYPRRRWPLFFVSLGGNAWRSASAAIFVLALPFLLR